MNPSFTIVGIGEALYDLFPGGRRLGGAPLNVAVHAHQLATPHGGRGVIVSRVGQDDLGRGVEDELRERGMSVDHLQTDPDRPTGRVYVDFDIDGDPTYEIALHAAWDNLQFDPDLESLAQTCEGVCFGTLAQRDAQTRNTIYRFLDTARRATRLFDVNLRGPAEAPFYDSRILRRSCETASIVKLNRQELPIVLHSLGLNGSESEGDEDAGAAALLREFPLEMVALTRGAEGTVLYTRKGRYEGAAASYEPAPEADAVGAGDACAAAILVARSLRLPAQRIADVANQMGAYVAGQPGGTPTLPEEVLGLLRR